jgi:TfoX/Sxy family transcriptional regulator of competence genes
MAFPKPDAGLTLALDEALAEDDRVQRRKMFGCPAVFVAENGHMFGGVFGDCLNVRLDEAGIAEAIALGAHGFEPTEGRPMREYVCLPMSIVDDATELHKWLLRGLEYASGLPPKKKR